MRLLISPRGADVFDRRTWDKGRGIYDGENPRIGLTEAAKHAGVVVGARREVIRDILGEPDRAWDDADTWFLGRDLWAPATRTLVIDYVDGVATQVSNRNP